MAAAHVSGAAALYLHYNPSAKPKEVREALLSLPHDYKMVVLLADLEGFAYKEIAEILDVPIGTVMAVQTAVLYQGSGWSRLYMRPRNQVEMFKPGLAARLRFSDRKCSTPEIG